MRWLSVDPGQVHVGVAWWEDAELREATELTVDSYVTMLHGQCQSGDSILSPPPLGLIVVERFSLMSPRYSKQQSKQAVETIKLIGITHGICLIFGVPVLEQEPAVRHVAMRHRRWRELELPSNAHAKSAVAHGLYHLIAGKLKGSTERRATVNGIH